MFPGSWWLPILAIPILFLVWLAVTLFNIAFAEYLGPQFSGFLVAIASVPIIGSYGVSLFAPFALYHDRRYVSEHSDWTPNLLYLFVVVPLLNVLIASLYLTRRHRFVGAP
jgi:hypothetical protein